MRSPAQRASAVFEAGRVLLPEDAPWAAEYRRELLGFPGGRHDDQVDSTTQFLIWAEERHKPKPPYPDRARLHPQPAGRRPGARRQSSASRVPAPAFASRRAVIRSAASSVQAMKG